MADPETLAERVAVMEERIDRLHHDMTVVVDRMERASEQREQTNRTLAVLASKFDTLADRIETLTDKIVPGHGGGGSSPAAMAATATIAAGLAVAASKVIPL